MDFSPYDTRHYPMVSVQEGYGEWVHSYENPMLPLMDLALLDRLGGDWRHAKTVVDLACGTGRIGGYLARDGRSIVGVDITEPMMSRAEERGVYDALVHSDVRETGLESSAYELAIQSLACEHLPDLEPLYAEAARLTTNGGHFVVVGYHPFFMLRGIPTHFGRESGESVAIDTHVHLLADHVQAANASGWTLVDLRERIVDEAFTANKASWERHLGWPITFGFAWRKR